MLGCGEHSIYLTRRGGSPTLLEIAHTSASYSRALDGSAQASVNIPAAGSGSSSGCCEVLESTEPWRDELLIYRGNEIAFIGPVVGIEATLEGGTLHAQDLFFWTERRFIEDDMHLFGDLTDGFVAIFEKAMAPDLSPNIQLITHPSGVSGIRDYKGKDFHRAADLLRELARTALDFTTIGRTVYVGGREVFSSNAMPGANILLHNEGILTATLTKDGEAFATDVAVFTGGSKLNAGKPRSTPLVGRATVGVAEFGLVQQAYTELLIDDLISADANAQGRLEATQPSPLKLQATLTPEAAFEFNDLIPGRHVDSRLSGAIGCIPLVEQMRLTSVSVGVGVGTETITINVEPVSVFEDDT